PAAQARARRNDDRALSDRRTPKRTARLSRRADGTRNGDATLRRRHCCGRRQPEISILETENDIPWTGHTARYAMREVYDAIRAQKLTLVFVNTRMQAEFAFQEL